MKLLGIAVQALINKIQLKIDAKQGIYDQKRLKTALSDRIQLLFATKRV